MQKYLIKVLQSEDVLKVGFGLKSDRKVLNSKFEIKLNSIFDLNTAFRKKGYRGMVGARAAIAILFNKNFPKSKGITTSNWSLPQLSKSQLVYAANDAYVSLCAFNALGLAFVDGEVQDAD